MTLVQLEYVLAVAESLNFTVAAEKTFVTQPTLSMQIQKLEKELNVEIFDRSTHPIKITPIGEKIIAQAREVLNESKRMKDMVNEQKNEVAGDFYVGVIPTVLPTLVPLIYKNFTKKFPKAKLHIREMKTSDIVKALENNTIDFGLAVTPLGDKDIMELPLYYEPMVGYIPPNHRLYEKEDLDEKDLKIDDILLLEEGHCFRNNVLTVCQNVENKKENLNVDSGSFSTLIKLANDGFGMTILPSLHAEDLPEKDKKYLKKFKEPVPTREVSLIYYHTQLRILFATELKKLIQSVMRGKIYFDSEHLTFPTVSLK